MPSIRLADLAQQLDAELHGDGDIVITGVASMQSAQTGHITFMVNPKYREHLGLCRASAVVMTQGRSSFREKCRAGSEESLPDLRAHGANFRYHAAARAEHCTQCGDRRDGEAG